MRKLFIFLVPILAFTYACGNQLKNQENSLEDNTETSNFLEELDRAGSEIEDHSIPFAKYQATRTALTELIHTKLELTPDWSKSYLYGKATITAKPYFYPSDSLILDAKGMEIKAISLNGKPLNYTYKEYVLKIQLDKIYTRNERYTLTIDYVAKPNTLKVGGGVAVTSDKGLYFINPLNEEGRFMPQIWTQGETESNSVWFPTIDSPNFKSTQEVYLTVANKYKTLSNGTLVSSVVNADGTRTDYWKQDQRHSMYLFMIAVGEFEVVTDSYIKSDGTEMLVDYYVEPQWKDQAKAIFGKTPKMIRFFSDLLGMEYPWDKYSQIVVREYVSGAMENTTAVVFGDYVYKNERELADGNDEATIAHELFHHWFGNLVTTESWSNLALNEAFANYSQFLWDEFEYGLDVAQLNKEKDLLGYFSTDFHHNLVWFDYNFRDDVFDTQTYNKGGAILHQLRKYLGDDAFYASLNHYLKKHAYKTAEYNDLRIAFEEVTGKDLNWYFNQWFLGKGHPEVLIMQEVDTENSNFKITFDQEGAPFGTFVLPIVLQYVDDAGIHTKHLKVHEAHQSFSFPFTGKLQTIIVDPDKALLGEYIHKSSVSFWYKQYEYATNYLTKKEAIKGVFELEQDPSKLKDFIAKVSEDSFYGIHLVLLDEVKNRVGYDYGMKLGAVTDYFPIEKLQFLAAHSSNYEVRNSALDLLLFTDKLSFTEKINTLDTISSKEQSYSVLANVLRAYIDLDSTLAASKIDEFSEKHFSADINFQIGIYYLDYNVPDKIDFFRNFYKNSLLRDKWNALLFYGYYCAGNGFEYMTEFINEVNAVYAVTGSYKTYFYGFIQEMEHNLLIQEELIEDYIKANKAYETQPILDELKEVRVLYSQFLEENRR